MNDKIRKHIIELLTNGEDIPVEFQEDIFPTTKKEYELKYAGKEKKEVILNDTMSVPFQAIKHFGDVKAGEWANMLIFGDNLQALKHLLKMKEEGKLKNSDGSDGIKLIYIDPPFATKQDFQGNQEQKAYQDKIVGAKFIEFLRKRIILMKELLSPGGSIYVHLDWRKAHYIKIVLDEVFGETNFCNEIIWEYQGSWIEPSTYFPRRHNSIYFYTKGSNYYFRRDHEEDVNIGINFNRWYQFVENNKIYADNAPYHDKRFNPYVEKFKRGYGRDPQGKDVIVDFKGSVIGSVWYIKTVDPKSPEKIEFPTQKAEALLKRIINASSQEGDIVLDCFAGSGSTGAVAEKLNRKWIMADCGKLAIYTMKKRLMNLKKEIGNKVEYLRPKPFTLYNAGLYHDVELINKMQEEEYKDFVIELFGFQKREHQINGITIVIESCQHLVFACLKGKHYCRRLARILVHCEVCAVNRYIRIRLAAEGHDQAPLAHLPAVNVDDRTA